MHWRTHCVPAHSLHVRRVMPLPHRHWAMPMSVGWLYLMLPLRLRLRLESLLLMIDIWGLELSHSRLARTCRPGTSLLELRVLVRVLELLLMLVQWRASKLLRIPRALLVLMRVLQVLRVLMHLSRMHHLLIHGLTSLLKLWLASLLRLRRHSDWLILLRSLGTSFERTQDLVS